ncbi:MAG: hypothetical protein ACERKN_04625 [Velocimicrobium sp.]
MNRKLSIVIALLSLITVLGGCASESTKAGQQLARIEVYSVVDNTLVNTIEDEESLLEFNQKTECEEQWDDDYMDQQEEIQKKLEEREPLYIFMSYKKPVAMNNDGTLEKISEITVYKDSNIIKEEVSPDTVKNFTVPSEYLTDFYESSDETMDFLVSLTKG